MLNGDDRLRTRESSNKISSVSANVDLLDHQISLRSGSVAKEHPEISRTASADKIKRRNKVEKWLISVYVPSTSVARGKNRGKSVLDGLLIYNFQSHGC